ncbi:hypothetical protein [Lachnoclostridium sp. An169]|uniref:hypothetical protein n=1 Tax=Lachnoclostridium sp. An169 TaxID=1965569 RepID=UPI0013A624D7|nr:hypothetical protein [Lachnoclostridium sp. An169]HJA66284.1 hypothetical protein [Candidatus Mediterraneibacter cottocaccae]
MNRSERQCGVSKWQSMSKMAEYIKIEEESLEKCGSTIYNRYNVEINEKNVRK